MWKSGVAVRPSPRQSTGVHGTADRLPAREAGSVRSGWVLFSLQAARKQGGVASNLFRCDTLRTPSTRRLALELKAAINPECETSWSRRALPASTHLALTPGATGNFTSYQSPESRATNASARWECVCVRQACLHGNTPAKPLAGPRSRASVRESAFHGRIHWESQTCPGLRISG